MAIWPGTEFLHSKRLPPVIVAIFGWSQGGHYNQCVLYLLLVVLANLNTLLQEDEGALLAIRGHSYPEQHGGQLLPPECCPLLQGEAVDDLGQNSVILGVVDGLVFHLSKLLRSTVPAVPRLTSNIGL